MGLLSMAFIVLILIPALIALVAGVAIAFYLLLCHGLKGADCQK